MKNFIFKMVFISILILSSCSYIGFQYISNEVSSENKITNIYILNDIAPFESVENLTLGSTHIVRAEVLDERVEKFNVIIPFELLEPELQSINPHEYRNYLYDVFTVYNIRVLEVFKGNIDINEIVEVRILGGQLDDLNVISFDETFLYIGDELILFMYESFFENEPFFLSSPSQAVYRVIEQSQDGLIRALGAITFESLSPNNSLTLTLEDLERVAEENNR